MAAVAEMTAVSSYQLLAPFDLQTLVLWNGKANNEVYDLRAE